jgi:hypothetical protein
MVTKQLQKMKRRQDEMEKATKKLSVVETKSKEESVKDISERFNEARAKLRFMNFAIMNLWGGDSTYGNDTIFGCSLLMHGLEEDFATIHRTLDPKARD